jgi:hypothetical protein
MPECCVNLMELYGNRYRITWDPAYDPKGVHIKEPWMMQIPCERGTILPWGAAWLAVEVDYHPQTARKVAAIAGVQLVQDGDHEKTFAFPVGVFEEVAALVKPRKRRKCHLSPEQLRAGGERLARARRSRKAQGIFQGDVAEGKPEVAPRAG